MALLFDTLDFFKNKIPRALTLGIRLPIASFATRVLKRRITPMKSILFFLGIALGEVYRSVRCFSYFLNLVVFCDSAGKVASDMSRDMNSVFFVFRFFHSAVLVTLRDKFASVVWKTEMHADKQI